MKKVLSVLIVMLLVLAGCSSNRKSSGEDGNTENIKIAFITKAMDSEFWYEMKSGAEAAMIELGIEVSFQAPDVETNVERQFNIIQDAIASKYDAIIVAPSDSEGVVPILQEAKKAGIVVFGVDTNFDLEDKDGFVGTDNIQIGETAANKMYDLLKDTDKKDVVMITGVPGVQTMRDRAKGFVDNLHGDLRLVDEQPADSDSGKALNVMENMLTAHGDNIGGLFVLNTTMATGALRAIESFGTNIEIISVDTSEDHINFVRDGKITGFVSQDSYGMGYHSVVNAVKAIRGEEYEKDYYVEAILVTQDNLEEFLKDKE